MAHADVCRLKIVAFPSIRRGDFLTMKDRGTVKYHKVLSLQVEIDFVLSH